MSKESIKPKRYWYWLKLVNRTHSNNLVSAKDMMAVINNYAYYQGTHNVFQATWCSLRDRMGVIIPMGQELDDYASGDLMFDCENGYVFLGAI